MIKIKACKECGSDDVQSKAWVSLKDHTDIDFSLSAKNKSDDNWCNNCQEHTVIQDRTIYHKDDVVFWKDPENHSSGLYAVVELKQEDSDENSIYLISNGLSEVEVYEHELSIFQSIKK